MNQEAVLTAAPPAAATQPTVLARWMDLEGRHFQLRTLLPQDAAQLGLLWDAHLSAHSRTQRFHGARGHFTPLRLAQACTVTPALEQALVVVQTLPGAQRLLAEARWVRAHSAARQAELALSVADEWQARGLGRRLLKALVDSAHQQGVQRLTAQVLTTNKAMRGLLLRAGFVAAAQEGSDSLCFACAVPALHQRLQSANKTPAAPQPRRRGLTGALSWLAAALPRPQRWPGNNLFRKSIAA